MGTRHLVAIVQNNEYKVAQYGLFDGYPSGAGIEILNFLRENNLDRFAEKVSKCSFLNEEEHEAIAAKKFRGGSIEKFMKRPTKSFKYAHLSRDTGSDIFQFIMDSKGLQTINRIDFVAEGLFCEWAYVVDLDKQTFEVYRGVQKTPVPEDQRFASMNPDPSTFVPKYDGDIMYYPAHLVKCYPMHNLHPLFLPSNEDFLKECCPDRCKRA